MSEVPVKAQNSHEIRKYPNRRYYDTTTSRHVTLEEIHALIRGGQDVRVVDSKSGDDITGKVLAQIMIDLDPPKLGVFPIALLHRLLRSSGQLMTGSAQQYFNQALSLFLDSERNIERSMRQAIGVRTGAPTMADLARMMMGPFHPAWVDAPRAADVPALPPANVPSAEPIDVQPLLPSEAIVAVPAAQSRRKDLQNAVDSLRRDVVRLRAGAPKAKKRQPEKSARSTPRSSRRPVKGKM